jgi:phosphoribosylformylglycinamidine synthase
LTNKVDRCVGGVAKQQTTGPLQLPLNNCNGFDYNGKEGIATYRAPAALLDPSGSRTAIAEALSNIVCTYQRRFDGISLCKLDVGL